MKKTLVASWALLLALFCGLVLGTNITTLTTSLTQNRDYKVTSKDAENSLAYLIELRDILTELNVNEDVEVLKIKIANELYELANSKYSYPGIESLYQQLLTVLTNKFESGKSLLSSLKSALNNSISNIGSIVTIGLKPDETVKITATTAGKEAGKEYEVDLNGYIYYASNKSTKWVILVHGYLMNGKLMASSLGQMYLDKGYNVLAPDLRGFGKSGGSVAMGYLESLDIWDWLTYINDGNNSTIGDRAASEVMIHGVSLGGATTLQLWSQKGMGRDLTTKHVIGLVDDCGYHSMTGIIEGMLTTGAGMELLSALTQTVDKENLYELVGKENVTDLLINVIDVGIKKNEFELKQNALSSDRKVSDVPLYVIHGTADTTVPYTISTTKVFPFAISNGLLYDFWQVSNKPHAFIIVGMEKEQYKKNIHEFIDFAEEREENMIVLPENEIIIENVTSPSEKVINSLISFVKSIKSLLKI